MELTEGNYSIRNLARVGGLIQTKRIVFDNPIQRESDQWDTESKSLLIKSILQNYYIPPIFAIEEKREGRKTSTFSIIDGKQRLSIINSFFKNEFPISSNVMDDLVYNENTYDLTGLKYEALPEDLKEQINAFNIKFIIAKEAEDEEIEEMFYRLNNGKPLSRVQRAKSEMGIAIAEWISTISEHEFLLNHSGLTKAQIKNEDNLKTVIQVLMFMDDSYDLKPMTPANIVDYMKNLRERFKDQTTLDKFTQYRDRIDKALVYLTDSLASLPVKPLTKLVHLPMLIMVAMKAMELNVSRGTFAKWAQSFSDGIKLSRVSDQESPVHEYLRFAGQGSTSLQKVQGRLDQMTRYFTEFVESEK